MRGMDPPFFQRWYGWRHHEPTDEYEVTPEDHDRASRIDVSLVPRSRFARRSLVDNNGYIMLLVLQHGTRTVKELQQALVLQRERADEAGEYTYFGWIKRNEFLEVDANSVCRLSLLGRHRVYMLLKQLEVAGMLRNKKQTRRKVTKKKITRGKKKKT